ncbi:MAG TPA: hypothetical protein VMD30_08255 [Tepidisphaeraceae bacterium]|nr:hypothetical protein [Tepidisphaeraceae bacterium]
MIRTPRKFTWCILAAAGLLAALAGCQSALPTSAQLNAVWSHVPGVQLSQPKGVARVDTTPIQVDEAMELRSDWPVTPAVYDSLSMTTGSTDTPLQPADNLNPQERAFMETPLFIANIFITPLTFFYYPPGVQMRTPGLIMPPSYTANPPLTPLPGGDYSGRALGGGWETVR